MFAKVISGRVEVYNGINAVPVVCFGHGEGIISAVVNGNEIYCNCKNGTTHIYEFTGSSVQQKHSYR